MRQTQTKCRDSHKKVTNNKWKNKNRTSK